MGHGCPRQLRFHKPYEPIRKALPHRSGRKPWAPLDWQLLPKEGHSSKREIHAIRDISVRNRRIAPKKGCGARQCTDTKAVRRAANAAYATAVSCASSLMASAMAAQWASKGFLRDQRPFENCCAASPLAGPGAKCR
jgi:hypothetical protein